MGGGICAWRLARCVVVAGQMEQRDLVDQLPALPKCQLELTQVALGNRFTLLHGAEEGVESVPFRSEGLLVVLEATCRKEDR